MSTTPPLLTHPEVANYHRHAAHVTTQPVLHAIEKQAAIKELSRLQRRRRRAELEEQWRNVESVAASESRQLIEDLRAPIKELDDAISALAGLRVRELLGKAEGEQLRLKAALAHLDVAEDAIAAGDFSSAGAAVIECEHEASVVGGELVVAMNRALAQAAIGKEARARLEDNVADRRQAKIQLDQVRRSRDVARTVEAEGRLRRLEAAAYRLATEILGNQVKRPADKRASTAKVGRDTTMQLLSPAECESFADVGGLEDVKEQLRDTIGAILERPDEAARYQVVHNGVLFYGPPGTGKNLLSRALAGEYGLRYLRFSPAAIASAYLHEAAANLRRMFDLARDNAPCVLYLDEIDTIASDRGDQPSADHREVVTQLMICLEEYRTAPGLIIVAGTNELDRLDPALREGRFDAKIHVPLPDPKDRAEVLRVHLARRGDAVDAGIDLDELARLTAGYNAAALETVVSLAAQGAMRAKRPIDQAGLAQVIADRGGQHRLSLEESIGWDDVVLDDETRTKVQEILMVFCQPELARGVGVRPPAGIVLYGPPGTGKTTIAKAMASQIAASFYEMSAADVLSKWAGESEQRVAKLFAKARANRPSIVFIDEIDSLLRRRSGDSTSKWEERVLSQFLRELDGLKGGEGVMLVGATNRIDTLDEAIVGRRLEPIPVGLPDSTGRQQLLALLCRGVKLSRGVDLREIAEATEGLSGSDLKRLRDSAGMKALSRATTNGKPKAGSVSITRADLIAALDGLKTQTTFAEV